MTRRPRSESASFCSTPEQAGVVGLRAEGNDPARAIAAVNAEVARPCAPAKSVARRHIYAQSNVAGNPLYGRQTGQIVQSINVVAGFNGSDSAARSPPATCIQYAVSTPKSQSICARLTR